MGAWGTGLFDDDIAADIRGVWEAAIGRGDSPEAATAAVLNDLGSEMADDPDDGPILWITLAALQTDANAVHTEVKSRALDAMPQNIERWRRDASAEDAAERERVLHGLRERLLPS